MQLIIFSLSLLILRAISAEPSVLLQNAAVPGTRMPAVGLGTGAYGQPGNVGGEYWSDDIAKDAVLSWLKAGGIRIDNGNDYNVSAGVAEGMAQSGRPRESIFLVSKTGPRHPLGYSDTLQQVDDLLVALNTSYVDLLLIHWPGPYTTSGIDWPCYKASTDGTFKICRQDTWRAYVEVFKAGKARAIGVSNFEVRHLQDIFELNTLLPSVHQNEFHPYMHEDDLVAYCKAHNILYNSYSSVGCPDHQKTIWRDQVIDQPEIIKIAQKYNKTPAQVVLRWSWEQGLVVNARSWDPVHHVENLNIFDFMLTKEEIAIIGAVPKPTNPRVCSDPNKIL